ncbi:sensor histidine kinase [Leminorella grimontii]|uniref:sensor histidine kinase n=1 Tax=Leminorella grimontii TaxID=82981 RepID=UPI00208D1032|nr:HAMP domain-containing sensor histidine kinase [Leminorella grimontii]GKX58917.1 two-component sensor histidine kinase [Leminorella grimontii]
MKAKRPFYLFIFITLLLTVLIGGVGFRTLNQEQTVSAYQAEQLARSRVAQTEGFILQQLDHKQVRLSAMLAYLSQDPDALRALIAQDSDIEAIFILKNGRLAFPDVHSPISQKESRFIESLTPVLQDPSQLIGKQHRSDDKTPDAGWYLMQENGHPLLLYWQKNADETIGIKLSYAKLLADVIANVDFNYAPDGFTLSDSGQLLYQYAPGGELNRQTQPTYSQALPFPLHNWKIDYYAAAEDRSGLFYAGLALIAFIVVTIIAVAFLLYREFNRATLLARQQVSFVGQVSHELKTPLTNITLYAEMLKEIAQEEESPHVHYVDVIVSESRRLSRLIQNVLTFTKAPKLNRQEVDVNRLLEQVKEIFTPVFDAKGIALHLYAEGDIRVYSDVDRITQIISNLLSNAEKYAASGKRVELRVRQDDEYVYLCVRDYGNGLPERELKAIFQPFYRVKSTITEGVSGTGIGLTIARQLAESLSGTLGAENLDAGMAFILTLPRRGTEA